MSIYTDSDSRLMEIVRVDGDGNCLFSALASVMLNVQPGGKECIRAGRRVRVEICKYIKDNMEVFKPYIEHEALETFGRDMGNNGGEIVLEQAINYYLNRLSENGVWGGEECLYAATKIYNVRLEVHNINNKVRPLEFGECNNEVVRLLYNGYHYDGLREIVDMNLHTDNMRNVDKNDSDSSGYRLVRTSQSQPQITLENRNEEVVIGTWNVQGCADNSNRDKINNELE